MPPAPTDRRFARIPRSTGTTDPAPATLTPGQVSDPTDPLAALVGAADGVPTTPVVLTTAGPTGTAPPDDGAPFDFGTAPIPTAGSTGAPLAPIPPTLAALPPTTGIFATLPPLTTGATVPEPSALAAVAVPALLGNTRRRRRRK